jgi:hypothetical protein
MSLPDIEALTQELQSSLQGMSLDEAQATLAAAQRMMNDLRMQHESTKKDLDATKAQVQSVGSASGSGSGSTALPPSPPSAVVNNNNKKKNNNKESSSSCSTASRSAGKISVEMKAAMKEAEELRAEMERARKECDDRLLDTKKALASLRTAEQEKDKLAKKLASDTDKMGDILTEEQQKAGAGASDAPVVGSTSTSDASATVATTTDATTPSVATVQFVHKALPRVTLSLVEEESEEVGGGRLVVEYALDSIIGEDDWDEDDAIYLQCVPAPGTNTNAVAGISDNVDDGDNIASDGTPLLFTGMYDPDAVTNGDAYEEFVYTDEPVPANVGYRGAGVGSEGARGPRLGRVSVPLPRYGGWYCLTYLRTNTRLVSSGAAQTVVRERVAVTCLALPRCVPSPLSLGHPERKNKKKKATTATATADVEVPPPHRRRGAGPLQYFDSPSSSFSFSSSSSPAVSVCVEDLRTVHTLLATVSIDGIPPLCRASGWLLYEGQGLSLLIEADVTLPGRNSKIGYVFLPVLLSGAAMSGLEERYGGLLLTEAALEQDKHGTVVVRLPYAPAASSGGSTSATTGPSLQSSSTPSSSSGVGAVTCGACFKQLVPPGSITSTSLLPSGVFDNLMHEFICAEEHAVGMNMCSSEVTTPRGSLLLGEVQMAACPADVAPASLLVQCKQVPSVLDLFGGFGGALATAPFAPPATSNSGGASSKRVVVAPPPAVVNIDTCVVSCSRCLTYVGDAVLKSAGPEEEALAGAELSPGQAAAAEGEEETLSLDDVRDIRFALTGVAVPSELLQSPSLSSCSSINGSVVMATEVAVARALLHLNATFSSQAFYLHVPTAYGEETATSGDDGEGGLAPGTVMLMRVISTNYAVCDNGNSSGGGGGDDDGAESVFVDALKVAYCVGVPGQQQQQQEQQCHILSPTGREARVPLQYHELVALVATLDERRGLSGAGVLKGGMCPGYLLRG